MSAPHALVFGASGQIGAALLPGLVADGWQVTAVSRQPQPAVAGVVWCRGGFDRLESLPARCDAVISCGPLDLFSHWLAAGAVTCARVVAFGSTSVDVKQAADDPGERALAALLQASEARVHHEAALRGIAATVLRPTLIYGVGRDHNLSRIAAIAARAGVFLLPSGACGLRQPVHVDDLAFAARAAARTRTLPQAAYALPGGETLAYREMVARTLAALPRRPRLIQVPTPVFTLALRLARAAGRLKGLPPGAVARMGQDLVFDAAPAARDLGYHPRPFRPSATMFGAAP